jgi:hypothetical protein
MAVPSKIITHLAVFSPLLLHPNFYTIIVLFFCPTSSRQYVVSQWNNNSFIHLVVCLTTGPKPLSQRALYIVRSRASSFRCEYPHPSLRSFSSFLRLFPRLPVTSVPSFIFPSITCRRRQFLRNMWPIQLAFRLLISCRIFLCSLTLSNKQQ